MKKTLLGFVALLGLFGLASCSQAEEKPVDKNDASLYFDTPATDIDHYFSDRVSLADTGVTVKKNKEGKLEGDFILDGIAKLDLKSVTDGDTAVFHLGNGTEDSFTVPGKVYPHVTIRFMGIDTPESTSSIQPWGKKASNYGKNLLTTAAGIIVDASDLPKYDSQKGYVDRVDSNGTRWLGLVWYCPAGKDPEDLNNYRSYQLDMIEECYSFSTNFHTTRPGYQVDEAKEPVLYGRYNVVDGEDRWGTMKLNEVFFEADNRMQRTGKKIHIQGETDPNFDYNKKATELTITEAKADIEKYINAGTFVRLTGVITRFVGNNFYFQDENGSALYVYMGIDGNSITDMFNVGDTIKIQGRLCKYGGQYQMSGIEYKRETFVKVTDPDKVIPMPKPIKLTGNETIEDLKALVGQLVEMDVTFDHVGNPSKNGAFSITHNKEIAGHPLPESEVKFGSEKSLQVRVDGQLVPGYNDRYDEFKAAANDKDATHTYHVTGIMSIYFEADYQKPLQKEHEDWYYSYQIMVGNRLINGEVVNEIVELK